MDGNFTTSVWGVSMNGDSNIDAKNAGPYVDGAWSTNVPGVSFSATPLMKEAQLTSFSVAAPDVDDDSVIMRYNKAKDPEFYFSDPQVIAVIQAAPYFEQLMDEMPNAPSTEITQSWGSSTTVDEAVSFSFGMGSGIDIAVGVDAFVAGADILGVTAGVSIGVEAGWAYSHESERSVSTSFSAAFEDTVALSMAPYIRYYYQTWNTVEKRWDDSFIDTPLRPTTSQISVDRYDEVARENGWKTIRDNLLFGARAGDPTTYLSAPPVKTKEWYGTEKKKHDIAFLSVGSANGAVSKGVSSSTSNSNGVTWGSSLEGEASLMILFATGTLSAGVEQTGGVSWGTFNGSEFVGTVQDLPASRAADYGFEWAFGTWTADLSDDPEVKKECVVLNYLVRDVRTIPPAPQNLQVDSTTSDSVTLIWTDREDAKPEYHVLGRVQGDSVYAIGTVNRSEDGQYSFTDYNCEPGGTYQYALKTYSYTSGMLKGSDWTTPVTAITPREGGARILTQPEDVTVRSGVEALFTTAASSSGGSWVPPSYQWQVQERGEGPWSDIVGNSGASNTLRVTASNDKMSGNRYRCIINAQSGSGVDTLYTRSAALTVGKGETGTKLTVEGGASSGRADESVAGAVQTRTVDLTVPLQAEFGSQVYEVRRTTDPGNNDVYYLAIGKESYLYTTSGVFSDQLKRLIDDNQSKEPAKRAEVLTLTEAPVKLTKLPQTLFKWGNVSVTYCDAAILDQTPEAVYVAYRHLDPSYVVADSGRRYTYTVEDEETGLETVYTIVSAEVEIPLFGIAETRYYLEVDLPKGADEKTAWYKENVGIDGSPFFELDKKEDVPSYYLKQLQLLTTEVGGTYFAEMDGTPFTQVPATILDGTYQAFRPTTGVVNKALVPEGSYPIQAPLWLPADQFTGTGNDEGKVVYRWATIDRDGNFVPVSYDTYDPGYDLQKICGVPCVVNTPLGLSSPHYTAEGVQGQSDGVDFAAGQQLTVEVRREEQYVEYTQETGTPVVLSATVEEILGGHSRGEKKIPTGSVTFQVASLDGSYGASLPARLDGAGRATATWRPAQAGKFEIVARYGGDADLKPSDSGAADYSAYYEKSGWLGLACAASMTYGDALPLAPTWYDARPDGGEGPGKALTVGTVTYTLKRGSTNLDADALIQGDVFTPVAAGVYDITATYPFEVAAGVTTPRTVNKSITVDKRELTVRALDQEILLSDLPGKAGHITAVGPDTLSVEGLANGDTVDGFFTLTVHGVDNTALDELGLGVYTIRAALASDDPDLTVSLADFNARYRMDFQPGELNITETQHTVAFSAEGHGMLTAQVDGGAPISSGNRVFTDSVVSFAAVPENGYQLTGWTVTGGGPQTMDEAAPPLIREIAVQSDLEVTALFDRQMVPVRYEAQSPGDGTLTAHITSDKEPVGEPVEDGGTVPGGSKVQFEAAPAQGRTIVKWTVNGSDVRNRDGSLYRETTYTTGPLYDAVQVSVTYYDGRRLAVELAPLDWEGERNDELGTVSHDYTDQTGDGKVKPGSSFTITAKANEGYQVREWRGYGGAGAFEVLQGSAETYRVEDLQSDLDIRVVFIPKRSYTVLYGVEGGDGALRAESGGVAVTSGGPYPALIPITFTAEPDSGQEVAGWKVNGVLQPGETGKTLTLPALEMDVDVRVVFASAATLTWTAGTGGSAAVTAAGGTVDADTKTVVGQGDKISVTLTPDEGYELDALTLSCVSVPTAYTDGTGAGTDEQAGAFTVDARRDYVLTATFKAIAPAPDITVSAGDGGDVSASYLRKGVEKTGSTIDSAWRDGVVTFTARPDANYRVDHWTLDGERVAGPAETYVLPIASDMTAEGYEVEVVFAAIGGNITFAVAGGEGGLSASFPDGTPFEGGLIPGAQELIFTAEPDPGWEVACWLVDGQVQEGETGTDFTYTTPEEGGAHITVQFQRQVSVAFGGAHGTVTAVADGLALESGDTVPTGTAVTFTASPEPGYVFTEWDDGNTDNPRTAVADADLDLTARFAPQADLPITFGVVGAGGTLRAEKDGKPFQSGDLAAVGDEITFTAVPDKGYAVSGWSDSENGDADTYVLTVTGSHDVQVSFRRTGYTVTYSAGANGTVSAQGPGGPFASGATVAAGGRVVLTAAPDPGYRVEGWYLDGSADPMPDSADLLAYEIADLNRSVDLEVRFGRVEEHTVTITATGAGKVTATVNGEARDLTEGKLTVTHGDVVVLTAVPEGTDSVFSGWTVGGDARGAELTLNLGRIAGDVTVEAVFNVQPRVDLTVTWNDGGSVTGTAGFDGPAPIDGLASGVPVSLVAGQEVCLTAHPGAGQMLDKWIVERAGEKTESMEPTLTFSALSDSATVTAVFTVEKLYAVPSGGAGYTAEIVARIPEYPDTAGQIRHGGTVSFKVVPEAGKQLTKLVVNGVDCLSDPAPGTGENAVSVRAEDSGWVVTVSQVTRDITAEISAAAETAIHLQPGNGGTIEAHTAGGEAVTDGQTVPEGTQLTLTAKPASGYRFTAWGGDVAGTDASVTVPAKGSSMEIKATFALRSSGGGGGSSTKKTEKNDKTVIDDKQADKLLEEAEKSGGDVVVKADQDRVELPAKLLSGAGKMARADILITTPVASIRLPNGGLGDLASLGGSISVQATLEKNADGTATLTLDITADGKAVERVLGGVKVTVPYAGGGADTVALQQNKTGPATLLPKSMALDGTMVVPLTGPATALLTERPEEFPDTAGHWAREPIDFVTSHGLFQGRDDGAFDADGTMTRGMLWTVLARLESVDTSGGALWYDKGMEWAKGSGVSDGASPEADITREQLATMLWRCAGSPESDGSLDGFSDARRAGGFAQDALRWAVDRGILTGQPGGLLAPQGPATRAEVAAMLMRYVKSLHK